MEIRRYGIRPFSHRLATALALTFTSALPFPTAAQERMPGHLITHSEVVIDRPAVAIWPYILDPLDWKQGQRLRHLSGDPGRVGELFGGYDAATPDRITLHLQNVELRPPWRRTIKLMQPDGTLLGFASWTLVEREGRTTVSYDVSMLSAFPSEIAGHSVDEVEAMEQASYEANRRRFDDELEALKTLVEGP